MTAQPARSCLSCSGELPLYAGFCPSCGTPAPPSGSPDHAAFRRPGARPASPPPTSPPAARPAAPPGPPPTASVPPPPPPPVATDVVEAGPARAPRRPATAVVAGLVGVAVLAGAGVVAVSSWGDDGALVYGYGGHLGLPAAVTEEPDEDWTRQVGGDLTGLAALEDTTYVATEDGTVVGLDDEGDEEWTADVGGPGFLLASPDHEEVVIFDNVGRGLVAALSTEDGEALWTVRGDAQWFEDDTFYVATDDALVRYDLSSGDELWSADADRVGVGEAGIFVLADGELRRVDSDDGETRWAVDVESSEDDSVSLAVADDFVAVGGAEAVAYDAADGERLWSAGADGTEVLLYARDEVVVQPVDYAGGEQEFLVYDRDGETATIETDRLYYFVAFRTGGEQLSFDLGSGDLYGDDHRVVETYAGRPALADQGLYALDGNEISYYEYGEPDPGWTLDEVSEEAEVATGDGRLLVVADGLLTSYS